MGKEKNIKTLMACRYCPMCKQVCTSGNLSKFESDFPRGRALNIYSVFKGTKEYDSDIVNSIYNCFLCGVCMAHCEGEIYNIPELIKATRKDIVDLKKEPDIVQKIRKSLVENDNIFDLGKKSAFKE